MRAMGRKALGRRGGADAPIWSVGSYLDHGRRDDSVRCCKSPVHQLKIGNVKGSLECGLPVPELSHAMQSGIGVNLDIQEHKLTGFYLAEELRQILDFAPQLVSVYGPNRERLHINRVGLDYLGLSLVSAAKRGF